MSQHNHALDAFERARDELGRVEAELVSLDERRTKLELHTHRLDPLSWFFHALVWMVVSALSAWFVCHKIDMTHELLRTTLTSAAAFIGALVGLIGFPHLRKNKEIMRGKQLDEQALEHIEERRRLLTKRRALLVTRRDEHAQEFRTHSAGSLSLSIDPGAQGGLELHDEDT